MAIKIFPKLSKAEIEELHKKVPKPPRDFKINIWIKWKIDINQYNDFVWKQIKGSALDLRIKRITNYWKKVSN
jgi:hypothetical protein